MNIRIYPTSDNHCRWRVFSCDGGGCRKRKSVEVRLSNEERPNYNEENLKLRIKCESLDWQLSAVVQILNSFLSFLPHLESLKIGYYHSYQQREFETIQWRDFLRPFISVKDMTLESQSSVRLVAPVLQELAGETTEVLPALQNLYLQLWDIEQPLSRSVKAAIEQFSATRKHTVTVTTKLCNVNTGCSLPTSTLRPDLDL